MAEPPVPKTILRGHKAQVHAAVFLSDNSRLVTGDAEGYVVSWDLTIMRPRAVWRPHTDAILGIRAWGPDKIITHGRDNKLIVWKITPEDEKNLSTALPLEDVPSPRPQPWMLHLLEVNTMNFCAFASCPSPKSASKDGYDIDDAEEVCVAVPNTLKSDAIDIYSLPSQCRLYTVHPGKDTGKDTGMAMALSLLTVANTLILIAAFEDGATSVHRLTPTSNHDEKPPGTGEWITTYRSQSHTQPILSIAIHPSLEYFLSSSADDIIAKHPIPLVQQETLPELDPENRIIEELDDETSDTNPQSTTKPSLLSQQLNSTAKPTTAPTTLQPFEHPIKTSHTKHSGQQSLRVRSDGRIFATAGWDANVRVYSCKTMKELAVLQYHKVGCYAVAFANVRHVDAEVDGQAGGSRSQQASSTTSASLAITRTNATVKDRRIHQAQTAHWVAAGAKDGRVSLWDLY